MYGLVQVAAGPRRSGSSGRPGSGSRSWRPPTTSGSTSPPGSAIAGVAYVVLAWWENRAKRPSSLPRRTNAVSVSDAWASRRSRPSTRPASGAPPRRRCRSSAARESRPNALTAAGVTLCIAGSVAVYFEYKGWGWFWVGAALFVLGSILDILDGALARSQNLGSPFGAFIDSTVDRVGEGFMLGAIALVLHARRPRMGRRARVRRAGRLVPRQLHAREGRGARARRATSASAAAPSASS